jgi:hypothetical protein
MEDIQGNIHCREVRLGPTGRPEVRGVGQSQPGGVVELTNELQSQADVCEIRLYRHEIREDPHPTRGLQLISGYRIGLPQDDIDQQRVLKKGQKVTLHLEHGDFFKRYSFAAYDCAGKPVWYKKNIYLDADFVRDWKIRECAYPGKWRIVPSDQPGSEPIDVLLQVMPRALSAAEDGFTTYFASTEAIAGKMYVVACVMDPNSGAFSEQEVELGEALKDPDGYVYDAELGIVAPIPGATVSCDVFDEQVQVWDRWPAELYDGQINPQITTEDGYYAFLVPSGLFRVRAQAEGYATHTSPDLRVINEAVHYNVPMEKPRLYVPMLLR